DVEAVLEDVIDGYVTIGRAEKDYGVVIKEIDPEIFEYEIDLDATALAREYIRDNRQSWMARDPHEVAEEYKSGLVNEMDCVRQFGVILDWGSGDVLTDTTEQFRSMLARRTIIHWTDDPTIDYVPGTLTVSEPAAV
ncbi:hydantoinase B/oxoprolinase family protein, partial [Streptomyces sp. SID10244]|nr:hydantoinase B/oxoprolinase family protein [Streptomyces sp. SID10244]